MELHLYQSLEMLADTMPQLLKVGPLHFQKLTHLIKIRTGGQLCPEHRHTIMQLSKLRHHCLRVLDPELVQCDLNLDSKFRMQGGYLTLKFLAQNGWADWSFNVHVTGYLRDRRVFAATGIIIPR